MGRAAGNPGAEKLTPITREERFLEDIAEAVEGGGEVTPGSVVSATAAMTPEQAAQTRQNIGADTPETVAEWLSEHVDPETGYVLDNSLTVEGAAADAKAVGDEFAIVNGQLFELAPAPAHDGVSPSESVKKRKLDANGDILTVSYSNNVVSAFAIPDDATKITATGFPSSAGHPSTPCAFYSSETVAESSAETVVGNVGEITLNPSAENVFSVPSGAKLFICFWYTGDTTDLSDIGSVYVSEKLTESPVIERLEEAVQSFGEPKYFGDKKVDSVLNPVSSETGKYIAAGGVIATTDNQHSVVSKFDVPLNAEEICLSGFPLHEGASASNLVFYAADNVFINMTTYRLGSIETYIRIPIGAETFALRWYDENGTIGSVVETYEKELRSKLDDFQNDYYLFSEVFTVGAGGDYSSINDAITAASRKYPVYRKGGITCEVRILSGTVIHEQIAVVGMDLSYITITSEDATVGVNVDGFNDCGLNKHDLREPNVGAFIGGENGAGLPKVGTIFTVVQNTNSVQVCGYFANRSSKGVVLSGCGFDGFGDGCISNNESSITIREGIARNNLRYGVHARHNGEVSARSCDCSGNGVYGAYADRVANLDVREGDVSGSDIGIRGEHASNICACGTHAQNCRIVAQSMTCAVVDCSLMSIASPSEAVFQVKDGAMMNCTGATITDSEAVETNIEKNTFDAKGIIWG